MKIRINDRPDIQEIEVIINCVADDPLVNKIISALNTVDAKLLCRRQGETFQLGLADILYIESVDRKTFLYTEEQVYETDRRLYELEDYEQYAGELTDEAVAHVLDDFVDLRDAHGEHSFNWPVIYDNFSIFRAADQADRERSEYGYISVADAGVLSFHSPLVFSFDYTWQTAFNILFNSNVVFAIFLLIVLAPVFSEEYSSGAANVILSTRYGKSKVIQAKFTAAFLIAAISAVIFCVVILLACGAYFAGFEGWNADIQTQFMSNQSQIPIRMNNLQFFLVVMLFYWLSAVGTAVLACCCSALCKKSLIALIMSGVLYFLPYFPMKLGGVLGEWMFIFPIWSAKAQWVLRTAEHKLVNLLPLSCEMPVWIVIFTLIFTVVSFLITCKSFSEYQGT